MLLVLVGLIDSIASKQRGRASANKETWVYFVWPSSWNEADMGGSYSAASSIRENRSQVLSSFFPVGLQQVCCCWSRHHTRSVWRGIPAQWGRGQQA